MKFFQPTHSYRALLRHTSPRLLALAAAGISTQAITIHKQSSLRIQFFFLHKQADVNAPCVRAEKGRTPIANSSRIWFLRMSFSSFLKKGVVRINKQTKLPTTYLTIQSLSIRGLIFMSFMRRVILFPQIECEIFGLEKKGEEEKKYFQSLIFQRNLESLTLSHNLFVEIYRHPLCRIDCFFNDATRHFRISQSQNPTIDLLYVVQKRQCTYFEARKSGNV